jgi:hypothetical protein
MRCARWLSTRITVILAVISVVAWQEASATQLTVRWTDNATNEDGFKIERKDNISGQFAQIRAVGANITTYRNTDLLMATTYCYRIRAYNAAGHSSYSNQACSSTITLQTFGVFRPSMGKWYIDDGNGRWDGCGIDRCLGPFGLPGDLPVAGDWDGSGVMTSGVFDPSIGALELDFNGNGYWDDCGVDGCYGSFGRQGDLPIVGNW